MTNAHPRPGLIDSVAARLGLRRRTVAAQLTDIENMVTHEIAKEIVELRQAQARMLDEIRVRWREEDELLQFLSRRARADIEVERIRRAAPEEAKGQLEALRARPDYEEAWDAQNPLVSVRIASYNDTRSLVERAIPSVLAQTHTNFELVIVNDGPNEATREAVIELADKRIRYEEFPERHGYPEDPHLRWMVAGSPGMNRGANLAEGLWIAPLDDDDEFAPDHIEKLLKLAQLTRAEFAYGAVDQHRLMNGDHARVFSNPPAAGQISMQAAIYHSGLRFMQYDTESWRVDEPGDWNLIRRMRDIGVRMAATEDYVTTVHMLPYSAKTNS